MDNCCYLQACYFQASYKSRCYFQACNKFHGCPQALLQISIPSSAFKLVANLGVIIVVVELVANLGAIIFAFKLATNLIVANFGVFSSLLQWIHYSTTSRYDNPIPLEIIIVHKICDHDFEAL
jgi:hypothetical protein